MVKGESVSDPLYLLGFNEFELHAAAGPGDEVGIPRVVQQGHQELPELQRAAALVRRALTENTAALLLHFTCNQERNDQRSAHSLYKGHRASDKLVHSSGCSSNPEPLSGLEKLI